MVRPQWAKLKAPMLMDRFLRLVITYGMKVLREMNKISLYHEGIFVRMKVSKAADLYSH